MAKRMLRLATLPVLLQKACATAGLSSSAKRTSRTRCWLSRAILLFTSARVITLVMLLFGCGASTPAHAQFTTIINVPPDEAPSSIGSDTQLNVFEGGEFFTTFDAGDDTSSNIEVNIAGGIFAGVNARSGAVVNISGGAFHRQQGALALLNDSVVNVVGGDINNNVLVLDDSTLDISGGSVGNRTLITDNAVLNLSGGRLGIGMQMIDKSVANISGGGVGTFFLVRDNVTVNLSGGSIGNEFRVSGNAKANVFGGEFRLDGAPIDGLTDIGQSKSLDLQEGSILTGALADGTPFAMSSYDEDSFVAGSLVLNNVALPPIVPASIVVGSGDEAPTGIRAGQSLLVESGGEIGGNFNAGAGSRLVVDGGTVGENLEVTGGHVIVKSGTVEYDLDIYSGGVVDVFDGHMPRDPEGARRQQRIFDGGELNVFGGVVDVRLSALDGSELNESGGIVFRADALPGSSVQLSGGQLSILHISQNSHVRLSGDTSVRAINANEGGTLLITGGALEDGLSIGNGTAQISGGDLGEDFDAHPDSVVTLFGTSFTLDDEDVTASLVANEPSVITDRDVSLSGTLLDGSLFGMDLNSTELNGEDFFSPNAVLQLVLVDMPGDFEVDGVVDGQDFLAWQRGESPDPFSVADLALWEANFGASVFETAEVAAVPEPATRLCLATLLLSMVVFQFGWGRTMKMKFIR